MLLLAIWMPDKLGFFALRVKRGHRIRLADAPQRETNPLAGKRYVQDMKAVQPYISERRVGGNSECGIRGIAVSGCAQSSSPVLTDAQIFRTEVCAFIRH